MRFVHAADLHIDSPLLGLEKYDQAPVEEIRGATRRATENLVSLCIDEGADLLLLAGDLYDDDWRDYSTGLFFVGQMRRLKSAGIPVLWIRGNHDAASKITKHLSAPDNVQEISSRAPESVEFPELSLVVHGMGYPRAAVEEDLSTRYPDARRDLFNVGLLHTALDGRVGHARYAPTTLDALVNKGYEYWALGHVHTREVLHRDPWVIFPGNLQGRHMRETGPKGATLVEVDGKKVMSVEHRVLDVVRFSKTAIDVSDAADLDDMLEDVQRALARVAEEAEDRLVVVRVALTGVSRLAGRLVEQFEHLQSEVRSLAMDAGVSGMWLESLHIDVYGDYQREVLAEREDAVGELMRYFLELATDDESVDELRASLVDLRQKVPQELWKDAEGRTPDDPARLRELLVEVERLVVPRVLSEGGT